MATSHLCSCFGNLRPRYKRLVDNIFPTDPRNGLVKSNMEKLTFYALSTPEKLDRIGDYLAKKVTRDVYRRRFGYVFIAMEALDQLLLACHAPNLNLFVESFLKMVQTLLETTEPDLQVLASQSFVKFANIEEDTPSYHRRYDFFVSKFSAMCWNNHSDEETKKNIRLAGLKGLQGVVRKTVSDDLQVNIWDPVHMGKIIPSLLFIMEESEKSKKLIIQSDSGEDRDNIEKDPGALAESCLRELISRANFGNIKSALSPVFSHIDSSELWVPNEFAVKSFKIIMYSIQNQFSYMVVQMLLHHLDRHSKDSPKIKASIVEVLSNSVAIATGSSIGPSVLEVFNTLLRHLRQSVDDRLKASKGNHDNEKDEKIFEEAVIETVGAFASVLPDFQKIEIMMFIMGKVPLPNKKGEAVSRQGSIYVSKGDRQQVKEELVMLQKMLLRCLLKVARSYTTVSMSTTFPSALLEPLIQVSIVDDHEVRDLAQEVFHTLLDRHDNLKQLVVENLLKLRDDLKLDVQKCSKQDLVFIQKYGDQIYWHLYENARIHTNTIQNVYSIYITIALLCIELGGHSVILELVRLVFAIQDLALVDDSISSPVKCALHALVAAFFHLVSELAEIESLKQHVSKVVGKRQEDAAYLLPEVAFISKSYIPDEELPVELLVDKDVVRESLEGVGCDTAGLHSPYIPRRLSEVFYPADQRIQITVSDNDIHTPQEDARQSAIIERVTFEMLKELVSTKPDQDDNVSRLSKRFDDSSFEDLVSRAEGRVKQFNEKVGSFLDTASISSLSRLSPTSQRYSSRSSSMTSIPGEGNYEMNFPDLFVY